jgi:hypothetical protein
MKILKTLFVITMLMAAVSAADPKTGEDVIREMYKKYQGKWYKTLTFVQKTTFYKADGTVDKVETWYEALTAPGKLRIDVLPLENNNGNIFADGKLFQFRDGKTQGGRPFVHPLLVLGFDVYVQPAETTIAQVKGVGIDLTQMHEAKWNGMDMYVVGGKQGDMSVPQVWIDKKNLLFHRLIQLGGPERKRVMETQFLKYEKAPGGGWVAVEVKFFADGKMTLLEEYTEVRTNVRIDPSLYDAEKFTTADKSYWQKQKP